jgi:hypothetical protein
MQLEQILGLGARAIQAVVESASSLVAMHAGDKKAAKWVHGVAT